ncbi:MAG TPA: prenyltransferase/squalene oxidase repeat-containing protein [Gemmataceae bacterium]|nr:prenyltransferase/squalene oxidase repeat-containing protein [Gemmataceae bacterium]
MKNGKKCFWLCLCALTLSPLCRSGSFAAEDKVDRAVAQALTYLHRAQTTDGCWKSSGFGSERSAGVTGLSAMAFLSAGQTPTEGEHSRAIADGVRWVLNCQKPNGVISTDRDFEMYHHGICTLMLAEVIGMCPPDLSNEVRPALAKAVDVILKAQRQNGSHGGGWRYTVYGSDADLSVTGWQLLALRAAKNVGCDVPASAIEKAVGYVRRCYDENQGTFTYTVRGSRTVPCAGTGILGLELCGRDLHRCRESLRAGAYVLRHPPTFQEQHCFYGLYYCSQAMFQLGDNYWTAYRGRLHELLLPNQRDDGSWFGADGEARRVGPNYTTAMAVLALTVEYRFLPIYQRGEEPTDGTKDK